MFFVLFYFWGSHTSSTIRTLLVILLAHIRKRSNSYSQMFFETGVLKNFAIFTCSLRPVHYTFPKFYLMIDNWYFRVIFYYCKIRPRNRKNFAIDSSKFLVRRWFFVKQYGFFSSKEFFYFFLLFTYFPFTEICK